ncbi:hypothetical protein [Hymenobacter glacialis]|uniref:Antitoxin VbhA domain-containing protein n=1 Tax=Hymenobacter glacialis TaxID=1908236 RepID=A0A1G1TB88_9BACT|nr:hypothetical protein [Hymenobacter glacialis]OGX88150.1 hypothetical protein BEN48_09980 [Hymenobacter glacialis]
MVDNDSLLTTECGRRRMVEVILRVTKGTRIEPKPYEKMLLDQFVRGELTDDHVLTLLNAVNFR